ncbi:MAG: protein kinase [Bryobacteraceae bacterium]
MNGDWERAKELFAACLELDREGRRALLGSVPDDVRCEVESLLAADESAGGFLSGRTQPSRLGAYRLVEKLGEGGMGTVWRGERADGQFERQVAIKIVREHFDTAANLERFRVERQTLAELEHPNIARLFDGGTTEGGLPYFVMELIEGPRIDAYVRERRMTADETLRLFLPVCEAVAYANARGVLHRDIKPANILVSADGAPKLVDFGIAKTIDEAGPATATVHRMATPGYASPEHLAGKPLTAASDVYSLGATLRGLLTGEGAAPALPVAVERIVAKAMHRDPERRYATARELAADIERYLDGQPVQARGDGLGYRAAQFARPHWKALAALAVGASAVGLWTYWSAPRFDNRTIAVVGIEQRLEDQPLHWLERGIAETLTMSLLHSGAFRVISADRARAAAQGRSPAEAAKALPADLYVTGVLAKAAARIRFDLRVVETANARVAFAESFEAPSAEAAFSLADQAAARITERLTKAAPQASESKALLTANPEALRFYEEARAEHGKWRLGPAAGGFRRALEADPDFAMAYAGLAQVSGWWDRPGARGAILRAADIAVTRRLPKLPLELIQGLRLYYDGRLDEAVALLRAAEAEFPGETEPLFWEGMAQTYAFRRAEARATFGRVTQMDGGHALGWLMLAENSALDAAPEDARKAAARYCQAIGEKAPNCHGLWGDVHLAAEQWDQASERYEMAKMPVMQAAVAWLRGETAESLRRTAGVAGNGAQAKLVEGNALAASGDLAQAAERYESAAALYKNPALGYLQLLKAAEIWLELGKPERVLAATARIENPFGAGLAAVAHSVRGDQTAAETEFAAMKAALPPLVGDYLAGKTEAFHRMLAAHYRGDHEAAVRMAAALPDRFRMLAALPAARSLLELGRLREARELLEFAWRSRLNLGGPELFEEQSGLRVALTEFYQARVAEREGRKADARRWAVAFLRRFSANAAVRQVAEARALLAGASSE